MQISKYTFLAVTILMLSCTSVPAFQESSSTSFFESSNGNPEANIKNSMPGTELNLKPTSPDTVDNNERKAGIQIPGSGFLGIFPKFNFGLELLYGENREAHGEELQSDDGFIMKGAVRKNF